MKRLEFNYLSNHCLLAKYEEDALELMKRLNQEMERRITLLEKAKVVKIQDYKKKEELPFIVVVVDELSEIKNDKIMFYLDRIVRLARAVGISVVAATQRPSTNALRGGLFVGSQSASHKGQSYLQVWN